ncbi:short-chain collagen C4-like [Pomacea canaliculata]|uniref:short-chain collagen C4-like n=1 Tax=Pomacea canaliculata TaxID=400727 RepID=UPI000D7396E3|nr:short-chain collagen C4-like [Pomacea canaliculata]
MSLQSIGMFICFIICVCTQFTPGYLEGSSGNTEQKWRPNSYHERFDFIDDQVRQLLQLLRNGNEKEQESLLLLEKAANNLEAVQKRTKVIILKERLSSLANDVAALRSSVESGRRLTGSVFTRWGNSTCPPTSERVYWGYAGGPLWTHTGSGSNLLCLPSNPVYDDLQRTSCGPSTVYGVEYHVCPDPKHFSDAVCAVCRSEHATTIMIPATNVCPPTWTKEYTGHVMAGYGDYKASSDYVCIDDSMEVRAGGGQGLDSQRLYYTISMCGSLPCPPYQNEKILTCVVCSK